MTSPSVSSDGNNDARYVLTAEGVATLERLLKGAKSHSPEGASRGSSGAGVAQERAAEPTEQAQQKGHACEACNALCSGRLAVVIGRATVTLCETCSGARDDVASMGEVVIVRLL